MPLMHVSSWIVWALVIVLQPVLTVLAVRSGWAKRWPSLFVYLAFHSVLSFSLLGMRILMQDTDLRAALYFYSFWVGKAISNGLEVWMLTDIATSLAGRARRLRCAVRIAIPVAALVMLGVCLWLSLQSPMQPYRRFSTVIIDIDKAVSLAWLLLFLIIVFTVDVFGIIWKTFPLMVAFGLSIYCIGETALSWLFALWPAAWGYLSDAEGLLYIFVLLVWRVALVCPQDPALDHVPAEALSQYIQTRLRIAELIRGKA